MMFAALAPKAEELLRRCRARGLKIATAESCTGGLVAGLITSIAGSSDVFERGFVTYSNAAKIEMLGVDVGVLERYGAVSAECALAMAEGALKKSNSHIAVSVTGIAGPGGGSKLKPVGLVHFACVTRTGNRGKVMHFGDLGRDTIRLASVEVAIELMSSSV
jgi:nicotinamide-nucleotide amidase